MAYSLFERISNGWNAFRNRDPTLQNKIQNEANYSSFGVRPDRPIMTRGTERTVINSIISRIAVDAAQIPIYHCKITENNQFESEIYSDIDSVLNLSANLDQTGEEFKRDLYYSMLTEGCVAAIPTDTDTDINKDGTFNIYTMRIGRILEWYPNYIRCNVYNEAKGIREDITVPKKSVAILENPFYAVMNEPNSILRRLTRTMNSMDSISDMTSSGKLDLIIQLPYSLKNEGRDDRAERRRSSIEKQLKNSRYGVAYIDSTEKITQLNRPLENNMLEQVKYFTEMLYSEMGITQSILDGTADEKTMLNYINHTIIPLVSVPVNEFKRKFLTKTARTQRQSFKAVNDPFKYVPTSQIADMGDKLTRNEILSSNEVRSIIGFKFVDAQAANELRNKNLNEKDQTSDPAVAAPGEENDQSQDYQQDGQEYEQ